MGKEDQNCTQTNGLSDSIKLILKDNFITHVLLWCGFLTVKQHKTSSIEVFTPSHELLIERLFQQ